MGGCEIPVAPSAAAPGLTQRGRYAWSPLTQSVVRQRGSAVRSEQKTRLPVLLPHGSAGEGVQLLTQTGPADAPCVSQHCVEEQSVSECSALSNGCALIPALLAMELCRCRESSVLGQSHEHRCKIFADS